MLDQDDGAVPLRRTSYLRSYRRAGSWGTSWADRLPKTPLVFAVLLAAAGAASFVGLQPTVESVEVEPLVERVPTRVDPIAFDDEARPMSDEPIPVQPAVAPTPPAAEPESKSVFRLDNLPVLEADETSLGIDDALDAITAPIPPAPPPSEPPRRRASTSAQKRVPTPGLVPTP